MIVDRATGLRQLVRESLATLAVLFAWDVVVVVCFQMFHRPWMDQPALPYALIGSALALFLAARNSHSSARWWDARILWGAIASNTRIFARQCDNLLGDTLPGGRLPAGGRPDLVRAAAAYPHLLRAALSRVPVEGDHTEALLPAALRDAIAGHANRPNALLPAIGREIAVEAARRGLDGALLAAIDRTLADLTLAQGGLERLRNTPLFVQFAVLPRLFTRIFCIVLPLSMVQELGWLTPLGSALAGFLFLALDDVGADLEDPFAPTVHALPMRAIVTAIEIDLLQGLGEPAPPQIRPVSGVLV